MRMTRFGNWVRLSALAVAAIGCQFLFEGKSQAAIIGVWEFNTNNVGLATVGNNLTVVGTSPTWSASQTYNGRTLTGVIDTTPGTGNHLIATHGIAANGGGTRVNQYSLLFDIRRPNTDQWRTLFQSDITNSNDGDYFVRNSDARLGVGSLGYTETYQMPADQWARVVITSDLAAGGAYRTYVDGTLVHTHTQPALDSDRFSFLPTVLLFGDEDNENQLLSVGAIAMWDQSLTATEVGQLGFAGTAVPEPSTLATVGFIALVFGFYRQRKSKPADFK